MTSFQTTTSLSQCRNCPMMFHGTLGNLSCNYLAKETHKSRDVLSGIPYVLLSSLLLPSQLQKKVGNDSSLYSHIKMILSSHFIQMGLGRTAAAAKSLQSCPTLCDPIDGSPPGSPVPGILQARTLEWVAISFSDA